MSSTHPDDARLDALFDGDTSDAQRAALMSDPDLAARHAELAAVERQLAQALGQIRSHIGSPQRVVANWTATCRSALPEASARRRAAVPSGPRTGVLATMILFSGVVGMLVFTLLPRFDFQTRRRLAVSTLGTLQLAILEYHSQWDAYPPSGNDMLVRYLDGDPSNGGPERQYFPFVPSRITPSLEYLDPWGRPYQYCAGRDAAHNSGRFDLWSLGPDQRDAEELLANWIDGLVPTPPVTSDER